MRRMQTIEKVIGENTFYIRPFGAFAAANISGELAALLSPILAGIAPLFGGLDTGDGGSDATANPLDMDIEEATAVTLGAKEQQYHCDGGEVKTYSAADVVVLYAAYKNYVTKHTTYCNLLKKWIKRETDNAVIGAIQYGDNLPEDLTAQMKTILDAATAQLTSITTAVSDGAFADKISSLENQMTETQMALCDVYEQVIAVTSATEG